MQFQISTFLPIRGWRSKRVKPYSKFFAVASIIFDKSFQVQYNLNLTATFTFDNDRFSTVQKNASDFSMLADQKGLGK